MHPFQKSRGWIERPASTSNHTRYESDFAIDKIALTDQKCDNVGNAFKLPPERHHEEVRRRRMPSNEIAALLSSDTHFREYVRNLHI
jgi:hypothetical protein